MKQISRWHFIMAIVLPMLFAGAIAWFQTYNLINELVVLSDKASFARSEKLIRSGLKAYRGQLEQSLLDNADWQEAAKHVYGDMDMEWVESTWSTPVNRSNGIYDTMAIIDGASSAVLLAHGGGRRLDIKIVDIFGTQWSKILTSLPRDTVKIQATSFFVRTSEGVSVAAVAPVSTGPNDVESTSNAPRYLVFVRNFDKPLLAKLAEQYAVRDLALFDKDTPGRGTVSVSDDLGSYNPVFTWQTNQHNFASKRELWARAAKTLAATLLVLLGMAVAYWRLLLKVQESERRALHAAYHDNLTGLRNRAAFSELLEQSCQSERVQCSVAFADLDGFKAVNDSLGHKAGDLLLVNVARTIEKAVGNPETIFRLGGDEFVALFVGEDHARRASTYAIDMIEALRAPIDLQGHFATVGISIGIAQTTSTCMNGQELVRRADEAMYQAKQAGRNRHVVFDESQPNLEVQIRQLKQLAEQTRSGSANTQQHPASLARRHIRG